MRTKQLYLFKEMKTPIDTSGKIFVNGYRRGNGTQVKAYWRKSPNRQIGARKHLVVNKGQLSLFDTN